LGCTPALRKKRGGQKKKKKGTGGNKRNGEIPFPRRTSKKWTASKMGSGVHIRKGAGSRKSMGGKKKRRGGGVKRAILKGAEKGDKACRFMKKVRPRKAAWQSKKENRSPKNGGIFWERTNWGENRKSSTVSKHLAFKKSLPPASDEKPSNGALKEKPKGKKRER